MLSDRPHLAEWVPGYLEIYKFGTNSTRIIYISRFPIEVYIAYLWTFLTHKTEPFAPKVHQADIAYELCTIGFFGHLMYAA